MLADMPQGHAAAMHSDLTVNPAPPFWFVQSQLLSLKNTDAVLLTDTLDEVDPAVSVVGHAPRLCEPTFAFDPLQT